MNSRKSWISVPLLKNIIKNNLFPAKVSLVIFMGVFIISLISNNAGAINGLCIFVYGISAVVLTTIYPCFLQSYQVNKTKSSMMAALPLSSECVWFTNYLAGYLIALVTLLGEGIGLVILLGFKDYGADSNMIIRFFMAVFMLLFIYYTLAYLVCSLSGNRLGQVVFSLVAYALPVILLVGIIFISPRLVPSNYGIDISADYLNLIFPLSAGMQFINNDHPQIFFHLFLGIVALICSYYIYRNRENEYIGEPLVFRKIVIVLKAVLIVAATICIFGLILAVSKIDITYGFKGQVILFLIYLLVGIIIALLVEIIFKGKYIYRYLLVYVPVLAIVYGANFLLVNEQYHSIITSYNNKLVAELTTSIPEYNGLSLDNKATNELLNYLEQHRDELHYQTYENQTSNLIEMCFYLDSNVNDERFVSNRFYYVNEQAVIDFFNGPGNKSFNRLVNNTKEISKKDSLICYVDNYTVYLNSDEIKELVKLMAKKISPDNIFDIKMYNLHDLDEGSYSISSNEAITNFVTSDELIKRAVFIESCRDTISEINSDSLRLEELVKTALKTQFNRETIASVYSSGNEKMVSFSNDEVVYQSTYEISTEEGNSYTYPLEFILKQGDNGVIISDVRVGG